MNSELIKEAEIFLAASREIGAALKSDFNCDEPEPIISLLERLIAALSGTVKCHGCGQATPVPLGATGIVYCSYGCYVD